LKDVFSKSAIECVEAFFAKTPTIHKPFEIVENLKASSDFLSSLSATSKNYKFIAFIGISRNSLKSILSKETVSVEDAGDILGEFLNSYCGLLQDYPDIKNHFGAMTQGLPFLYTGGHVSVPFVWGVEGYLSFGNALMHIAFSVRENIVNDTVKENVPLKFEKRSNFSWITLPSILNADYYSKLDQENFHNFSRDEQGMVLDFLNVKNIYSLYIRLIIRLKQKSEELAVPLYIVNVTDSCKQVLDLSNMTKILPIITSEKEFWEKHPRTYG